MLFALGNSGDWVVNAGEQIINALDHALEAGMATGTEAESDKEQEPLLLWAESASASDNDEPTRPPAISPARGPPAWEDTPVEVDQDDDPLAQPKPEVEFDQRVQW